MPIIVVGPVVVLVYFALVTALLRLFTGWTWKALLVRACVLSLLCNVPLLMSAPWSLLFYILVAVAAMRILISAFDLGFIAGVFPIGAASVASIAVTVLLR